MAKRMSRESMNQSAAEVKTFTSFPKTNYVNLHVDKDHKQTEVILRLVGFPVEFWEHSATTRVPDPDDSEKMKTVKTPFFDDAFYPKPTFSRICFEDNPEMGACPWCKAKYTRRKKWAQQCLIRDLQTGQDGKPFFVSTVGILNKGTNLFIDQILDKENANAKINAMNGLGEDDPRAQCTFLGGENAPNFILTATFDPKQPSVPNYSIALNTFVDPITEADIDLLRAIREPNAEELEKIYLADEEGLPEGAKSLRDFPVWFNYGYNLARIFKPTEVRTEQKTTSRSELTVTPAAPEEEAPAPARTRRAAAPATAPAAAPARSAAPTSAATASTASPFAGMENEDDGGEPEGIGVAEKDLF